MERSLATRKTSGRNEDGGAGRKRTIQHQHWNMKSRKISQLRKEDLKINLLLGFPA
jgi:hypothetical protein